MARYRRLILVTAGRRAKRALHSATEVRVKNTAHESDAATGAAQVVAESATPLAHVAGAEPPPEQHAAERVHRHESAAGLYSIYETMRRGVAMTAA